VVLKELTSTWMSLKRMTMMRRKSNSEQKIEQKKRRRKKNSMELALNVEMPSKMNPQQLLSLRMKQAVLRTISKSTREHWQQQ
jgi:hypothetical protein